MAQVAAVTQRMFAHIYVCMKCNAKIRGKEGKKPVKCRKCHSKRLRLKHKAKKG